MTLFRRPVRALFQIIGVMTVLGLLAAALALPLLPRILQVEDTVQKADYIVPLAGDWHRLIKAAELYKAGFAPKVLLSNAKVRPPSRFDEIRRDMGYDMPGQREMRRRLLLYLGVPEEALAAFGKGHISTAEEAEAFRKFLKSPEAGATGGRPLKIILVTSPYHTRRARMIFESLMPGTLFMVTSPPEGRLAAQWWRDQKSAQIAVSESFKFAFYLLGGRFQSPGEQP